MAAEEWDASGLPGHCDSEHRLRQHHEVHAGFAVLLCVTGTVVNLGLEAKAPEDAV